MMRRAFSSTVIAFLSFLSFYAMTITSLFESYAPSSLASFLMRYGIGALMLGLGVFFGFMYKWPSFGQTSWSWISASLTTASSKRKKLAMLIVSLIVFPVLVAFSTQRWLAYPTKWFATNETIMMIECSSSKMWGKAIRNRVMIEGVDMESGEMVAFPWPTDQSPSCPGRLLLSGRSWMFGTFVTSISLVH